jgi:hypothetical protein
LASQRDASPCTRQDREPSDKRLVLVQHAEQGALLSTENVLPAHGVLVRNPLRSVGKVPVGEPSLFSEEKCLKPTWNSSLRVGENRNFSRLDVPVPFVSSSGLKPEVSTKELS